MVKNRCLSPFRISLVENNILMTDPDLPDEEQPRSYLDPLWEAPYLAKLLIIEDGWNVLDMGVGCGVLSLAIASRTKGKVTGVDLNPRAIAVSRFNAALNGIHSIKFQKSDLFSSLGQQKFDLVVFNSPTDDDYKFECLLRCGESILKRFFSALPLHLNKNGYCQINLIVRETERDSFHIRLLGWIEKYDKPIIIA